MSAAPKTTLNKLQIAQNKIIRNIFFYNDQIHTYDIVLTQKMSIKILDQMQLKYKATHGSRMALQTIQHKPFKTILYGMIEKAC